MISLRRKCAFAGIGGIVISFCYVAGKPLDLYDSLNLQEKAFYGKWLLTAAAVSLLLFFLWEVLDKLRQKEWLSRWKRPDWWKGRLPFFICMAVLFLAWLPALLSLFPGAFAYDAYEEWQQVHNGAITAHHPVLHVLILGGLVESFYKMTGSYNVGIAVYTIAQMLVMSFLLTLSIRKMGRLKMPGILQAAALLFFALSPVTQLFAISATKDVVFTGVELLFFLNVTEACKEKEYLAKRSNRASFAVTAFFTMILRNNGFYIVLATLVFLALAAVLGKKRKDILRKYGKQLLQILAGIFIPYLIYVGPFYSLLGVTPGGMEEMLSVPLQQMARVYHYEQASLEQEEIELLCTVVEPEQLEQYRATVSDFVKKGFQKEAFQENKSAFIKLWVKWGVAHPLIYVNSFLINTVDAWYPNAVVDGYRHGDGRSSYFDYQVDTPGTEIVLLKRAHDYYAEISLDNDAQRAPLAFLVLSPGWYFVLTFGCFLYIGRNRCYSRLFSGVILALHFATVLLGPMALVRYMLIFYYGFPSFLGLALERPEQENKTIEKIIKTKR